MAFKDFFFNFQRIQPDLVAHTWNLNTESEARLGYKLQKNERKCKQKLDKEYPFALLEKEAKDEGITVYEMIDD